MVELIKHNGKDWEILSRKKISSRCGKMYQLDVARYTKQLKRGKTRKKLYHWTNNDRTWYISEKKF